MSRIFFLYYHVTGSTYSRIIFRAIFISGICIQLWKGLKKLNLYSICVFIIGFSLELEIRLYALSITIILLRLILYLHRYGVAGYGNYFCRKRQFMTFEIWNFSLFENVINNNSPTRQCHSDSLRTKIGIWLTAYEKDISSQQQFNSQSTS